MLTPLIATKLIGVIWLVALALVVGAQLVSGRIETSGLLDSKRLDGRRSFSTARLQLLLSTAVFSLWLIVDARETGRLPVIPNEWLVVLAGSHSTYMVGKLRTTLFGH
jgi:hypothetical protein